MSNQRREIKIRKAKDLYKSFKNSKIGVIGASVLVCFIIIAIIGPILFPFDPQQLGAASDSLQPPSWKHLFGTDDFGRDILRNLISGTRTSLTIGILATIMSVVIGTTMGMLSGYYGGKVDVIAMRVTDFFLVLPWLPLAMVLAAILGSSIWNIIFVIGITSWAGTARVVRAQTLSIKERPFVERAIAIGSNNRHIMLRHILPNVFPLVFANTILIAALAILSETTLSFLGLGDTMRASWGMMLHYAFASGSVSTGAYWYFLPPGICIILIVLSFTFLGYAFDEILNPKLRGR